MADTITTQTSYKTCEYGHHPIDPNDNHSYWYRDESHGIPKMIHVCEACYKKHILKYFPDSKMAEYYRKQGGEQPNLFEAQS